MNQDDRGPFVRALQRARKSAYPPGDFVEQESFMCAREIRGLAERAGVADGVSVLDLCCGIAGPGRFITRELGCSYLGVDSSSSAVEIARESAGDISCRFEVARVPPVPPGPFDVVLLFETMLAFPDKGTLLEEVSRVLRPGGRFAFTLEEGLPLTQAERERMPDADTVWLTPLPFRGGADSSGSSGPVRRRAPVRDHARLSRQGDAAHRGITGAPPRRAVCLHLGGGPPPDGGRARAHA